MEFLQDEDSAAAEECLRVGVVARSRQRGISIETAAGIEERRVARPISNEERLSGQSSYATLWKTLVEQLAMKGASFFMVSIPPHDRMLQNKWVEAAWVRLGE